MRIECPHCHHRGFSALVKLTSTPIRPVRCRYCRHASYAQPVWSGLCLALALLLIAAALGALAGHGPGWLVAGLAAAALAFGVRQLLRQPSIETHRTEVARHRKRFLIVAALVAATTLGLLAAIQMGDSTPAPVVSAG